MKRQLVLTQNGSVRWDDPMLDISFPQKEGTPSLRSTFKPVEHLERGQLLYLLAQVVEEREYYRATLDRIHTMSTV